MLPNWLVLVKTKKKTLQMSFEFLLIPRIKKTQDFMITFILDAQSG